MAIEVKANAAAVKKALKRLVDQISDPDPVLEEIGDRLVDSTKIRFLRQVSPTGRPWKRSKLARKERRKTLIRSKWLLESIKSIVSDGELQQGTGCLVWAVASGRIQGQQQTSETEEKNKDQHSRTSVRRGQNQTGKPCAETLFSESGALFRTGRSCDSKKPAGNNPEPRKYRPDGISGFQHKTGRPCVKS